MKAVVLEDYAIQPGDLDWSGVEALVPDITFYGRTAPEQVVPRIGDAEIVFLNKCRIDEVVLARWASSPPVPITWTSKPAAVMVWLWPTCRATLLIVWRR